MMAMDGINFRSKFNATQRAPIVCLAHLRWKSVFQRPQQLMSRFVASRPVYFFEEPEWAEKPSLRLEPCISTGVIVATPMVPDTQDMLALRSLLSDLLDEVGQAVGWYYTPMALSFSDHIDWAAIVFDVMDELSAFRFAPAELRALEPRLMQQADVVFTGGVSLFEARKARHQNIHCFPSGVDLPHFMAARELLPEPADQVPLPRPLLGYFGVIDERIDLGLLAEMAELRRDWHFAIIGPLAKITQDDLPKAANIHWLGGKDYAQLPAYLSHWDLALMPFALNEATRFISPTKAPEYLAGGRRVISTPITDVVRRFEGMEAVAIARDASSFVAAAETFLGRQDVSDFMPVDDLLATISWDGIHARMDELLLSCETRSSRVAAPAVHLRPAAIADYLVVGAGFAGAVAAERLASAGARVLVIDKRPHIAGNAFDEYDAAGVLIHRYGPHIFHTNSDEVLAYLSRFTAWRGYEHRVLAQVPAGLVPMPINRTTVNRVLRQNFTTEAEMEAFFASLAEPVEEIRSAKDFVVSAVGRELYEMFFHGYTLKQWGLTPAELDRSVTARVPTRTSDDDRYFLDKHQCMPARGYTPMFENMLSHGNITLLLETDYHDIPLARFAHMIFTGPIDQYFGQRFGVLPYRSLTFEHESRPGGLLQPVGTINYPGLDTPYTRCSEFKHLTGQVHSMTSLCREISSEHGDPYYPVPNPSNHALFKRYEALADAEPNVTFTGRLGSYRYMNMDQVVAQSLALVRRLPKRHGLQAANVAAA